MPSCLLMIRREKTTIVLDVPELISVWELKKMIAGITKQPPQHQQLTNLGNGSIMQDQCTLVQCGLNSTTATAMYPATLGLAYRKSDGNFEPLNIAPYSVPPPEDYLV